MQENSRGTILLLWSHLGLNQGPPDYESGATNQLSYGTSLALTLARLRAPRLYSATRYATLFGPQNYVLRPDFLTSRVIGILFFIYLDGQYHRALNSRLW